MKMKLMTKFVKIINKKIRFRGKIGKFRTQSFETKMWRKFQKHES